MEHPLIRHFDDQFAGGGGTLEKISSVTDNVWWKQKSGRWRGAAAVRGSDDDQTAWLAAGGLRSKGDARDFYTVFAARGSENSDEYLPAEEDEALLVVDRKITRRDAWLLQIHLSSIALLSNAMQTGNSGPLVIQSPNGQEVLSVWMTVSTVEEDGDTLSEVVVAIQEHSFKAGATAREATLAILASIQPETSAWQVGLLSPEVPSYGTLITEELAGKASYVSTHGRLPEASGVPVVRVGTRAHYSQRSGLTRATVDGEPVEALCGYWFIPKHDHERLDVCEKCDAIRETFPG